VSAGVAKIQSGVTVQSDIDAMVTEELLHIVRRLLAHRSIDQSITEDDDLREVGLTSLDMVDLVLRVESELDVKIPAAAITPANFRSISKINALVTKLRN
jgi:acyl carrier protein